MSGLTPQQIALLQQQQQQQQRGEEEVCVRIRFVVCFSYCDYIRSVLETIGYGHDGIRIV